MAEVMQVGEWTRRGPGHLLAAPMEELDGFPRSRFRCAAHHATLVVGPEPSPPGPGP
jgi:hypothetical protein